ncbi:MAG: phosphotransferase [Dehalococcoidia bacterium]|nr:phosphotransferase [Dehalococcoidia bacterium]
MSRAEAANIEDQIDPRQALAALGYAETSEPLRIRGGWDTLIWRFQTPDGRRHALRLYFLPGREEMLWRERLALQACAAAGLPAPRVEGAGVFQDLPALVLSWCPGAPILSYVEKKPWLLLRLSRLFGQMQARFHAITPPPELAAGAPGDWLARTTPEYAELAGRLSGLGVRADALIHLDYHPLNVISDGSGVTGVIDWSGAAAGDPRADLARTYVTMEVAPVPPGPLSALLNLMRSAMMRFWRAGYEREAGPMPDHRPFQAWAGATMLDEIERVIDRPGVWGTREDIEKVRRMIPVWQRRGAR